MHIFWEPCQPGGAQAFQLEVLFALMVALWCWWHVFFAVICNMALTLQLTRVEQYIFILGHKASCGAVIFLGTKKSPQAPGTNDIVRADTL
jgi:hypothetical protein